MLMKEEDYIKLDIKMIMELQVFMLINYCGNFLKSFIKLIYQIINYLININIFVIFNKMPSTSQLTSNSRSMNGLNIINANSVFTDSLEVGTLQIDTQGTTPTRTLGDSTTNIANTQFVSSAISNAGANYVDLTSTQTITGEKFFTGAVEINPATLTTVDINSSGLIDVQDVYIHGLLNVGTAVINETVGGDLQLNNPTNGGKYIFKADDTGGTSREALNLSASTATFNGTIIASGATFNTNLPTSTLAPTTGNMLCNKTYVDSVSGGGVSLSGSNVWTGTNSFNTNLPTSTLTPSTSSQLTPKDYVDSNFIDKTTTQTITGDKTFTGAIEISSLETTYISNTSSIDTPSITSGLQTDNLNVGQNQTSGILFLGCRTDRIGAINIGTLATGNAPINIGSTSSTTQTATHNAITTFNKIPLCSVVPATGNALTNKTYTDGTFVKLTGNETVSGIKTFNNLPECTTLCSTNPQFANKQYVDSAISTAGGSYVKLTGNETIAGVKTFSSIPQCATASIGDVNDLINYQTLNNFLTTWQPYFNPIGSVITFAGSTAPAGYLLCDGTLYSQFTYPSLFSVIFTTYGGSGTNFRVPNYNGCFLRGSGSQVFGGVTYSGSTLGTRQQDAVLTPLTASNQGWRGAAAGTRECVSRAIITSDPVDITTGITPRFDRTATENRPFNHTVNYCIKF